MFGLKNIFPVYIILAEREYQEGFETMIFFSRNNQFFEIKIILLAVGKERKKMNQRSILEIVNTIH